VNGICSGSCTLSFSDISSVEPLHSTTRDLVHCDVAEHSVSEIYE
jgi:hypothetical protein